MKIFNKVLSYLISAMFLLSVVAYFSSIFPKPELPEGMVKDFSMILDNSGYMVVVKVFEAIGAILLLVPRFRALALVILIPITVNIGLFEVLIAQTPGIGLVLLVLLFYLAYQERKVFSTFFK